MKTKQTKVYQCLLALIIANGLLTRVCVAEELPAGVTNTQNPADISLTPQQSLGKITVPAGFNVTLFAGEPDLRRPIAFDFDDRGRLWVVENYAHPVWDKDNQSDRVLIFEDTDNDGTFDTRKVFWDKGRYLSAIAVGHGGVWLGNTPELIFIADRNADDVPDGPPVTVLDGFQVSSNNVLNNFHWGPDGWLYGAIGLSQKSKIGKPQSDDKQRTVITRGLWRMDPISHEFEVIADGMVNPWGADFNQYGDLFTTNTVIGHLWHIVPGMYCQRRATEGDYQYAYERIQSNANHLHWGGGAWTSSRESTELHSVAGGGHAHCGAMVYLGDNWPTKYHGALFTNNLHGNRVNSDVLVPHDSTYVAEHADDFLFGNDPWFRGLSIKYGPDGTVFVSDWHDFGECHDSDGSHRSSGRIYRISYGTPKAFQGDLLKMTNLELGELHVATNEWLVRHARRILHERHVAGQDLRDVRALLTKQFEFSSSTVHRLRAMWTLKLVGGLSELELVRELSSEDEHVRRWAVRLLAEMGQTSSVTHTELAKLALNESSPAVRLALASAAQRFSLQERAPILTGLVSHDDHIDDRYLTLMIWYALEPMIELNRAAFLEYATTSKIPLLSEYVVRRAADAVRPQLDDVVDRILGAPNGMIRKHMLRGLLSSMTKHGAQPMPQAWKIIMAEVARDGTQNSQLLVAQLSTLFGDKQSIAALQALVDNDTLPIAKRVYALESLLQVPDAVTVHLLHSLVQKEHTSGDSEGLRQAALKALINRNDEMTPGVLLQVYAGYSDVAKQAAIDVLVTRQEFVKKMLTAIETNVIDRADISSFALQQLRSFDLSDVTDRITAIWPVESDVSKRAAEIVRLQDLLSNEFIAQGNAERGRLIFERTCVRCHTLFSEGGRVGPDLTGSGRKNVNYLINNLTDPSAVIDPAYRLTTIITTQGRLLSGYITYQDDRAVVIRTQQSAVKLAMNDIDEMATQKRSMMPDGMLQVFSDDQIRDLFMYLGGDTQVALPSSSDDN
jgi:putative membrane-bound dehydrogenase-like protein